MLKIYTEATMLKVFKLDSTEKVIKNTNNC